MPRHHVLAVHLVRATRPTAPEGPSILAQSLDMPDGPVIRVPQKLYIG
jgi:hypothetical protein